MNTAKLRDDYAKVFDMIDGLPGMQSDSLFIDDNLGCIRVGFFPSLTHKKEAVQYALALFGKLTKDLDGNMEGSNSSMKLVLYSVLTCKIVGYKKEKIEIIKYTGKYKEIETPVYECASPLMVEGQK